MDFFKVISEELKEVEARLNEDISSEIRFVSKSSSYILKSGGKKLRPALLLLSAKACNFNGNRSINLACALELIHTATLVHDDVIDEAYLRRGKETLNARYDNKLSILLGDYLFSQAVSLVIADGDKRIMETIAAAVSQVCEGEILQTIKANTLPHEAEYLNIVEKKTASLFSSCCKIGALVGDNPQQTIESLADYGLNLGIAFQITDDILDLTSSEVKIGKSIKNDLSNGKYTLPVIYAAGKVTPSELFTLTNGSKKEEILRLIEQYGGFEYSQDKAKNYCDVARQNLKELKSSQYKKALMELVDYTLNRVE
ncbi:MAG: polyprenyl synthetase family protein [bacterium]|nr:polyprenyl synthetase family protein [bacterium]